MNFSFRRVQISLILVLLFLPCAFSLQAQELYDWAKSTELYPGLNHAFEDRSEPRFMKINVLRVDLSSGNFTFRSAGRAEGWGTPMPDCPRFPIRVERESSRKYLLRSREKGVDMVAAVNASPWSPWESPWTHRYAADMGIAISDGVIVDECRKTSPAFVVTKEGQVSIRIISREEDLSRIQLALPGFGIILSDGKPGGSPELHPRTVYGLSKDGKYLYLMVIDGRMQGISEGIGTLEAAELLVYFGAYTGINMDGGGSSTMVIWDAEKSAVRKLNVQKHDRSVANSLGICRVKK